MIILKKIKNLLRRKTRGVIRRIKVTYRAINDQKKLLTTPKFKLLLNKILSGINIGSDDVLPFINQESLSERIWHNYKLAETFHDIGKNQQAIVFIERAWMLSEFNENYLSLFITIHAACDDIEPIRQAHKAIGTKKANANKIIPALEHFNSWQNAYAVHRIADEYCYDLEILRIISDLAAPYAFPIRETQTTENRKIKLAYLVFGIFHINSVIVKISLLFAKYHNPAQFEVTFYIPEQTSLVLRFSEAVKNIKKIKEFGCKVVIAPDEKTEEESLILISKSMYKNKDDILITNSGLADLKHYFITELHPTPLVIGLCQGPAPQFISPSFDWSITWFKSLLLECPTDCTFVELRLEQQEREYSRQDAKLNFGISSKDLVIMSCGRAAKLQSIYFLNSLINITASRSDTYLILMGINELPIEISDNLSKELLSRIKLLGWQKNFSEILSMADIVVDTYPSGGGVVIKDAMALGTPVVSFKHNYMKLFTQTECSASEEVIGIPELLLERGDFEGLNKMLTKLLNDYEYRESLSELCITRIKETSGNPERMVRSCEKIYLDLIRKKLFRAR